MILDIPDNMVDVVADALDAHARMFASSLNDQPNMDGVVRTQWSRNRDYLRASAREIRFADRNARLNAQHDTRRGGDN